MSVSFVNAKTLLTTVCNVSRAQWFEVCEFKLDRADYAPQLGAIGRAGLRVSSVQPALHAVFPDSLAPAPRDPQVCVRHFERSMERIAPGALFDCAAVHPSAARPVGSVKPYGLFLRQTNGCSDIGSPTTPGRASGPPKVADATSADASGEKPPFRIDSSCYSCTARTWSRARRQTAARMHESTR